MIDNLLAGAGTTSTINNPIMGDSMQSLVASSGDGATFFALLLPKLIGLALVVGVVIFLFMLIFGAIQWITSGGDKASLEGARSKISSAIVGLVILFSTFAILALIEKFFDISILTLDIGPLVIQ